MTLLHASHLCLIAACITGAGLLVNALADLRTRSKAVEQGADQGSDLSSIHTVMDIAGAKRDHG